VKITVMHGQSHKGSTYNIAKALCDKLGGEVTEFFLPRDFNCFCQGCAACFTDETKCPLSTAAGAGMKSTIKDMADSTFWNAKGWTKGKRPWKKSINF